MNLFEKIRNFFFENKTNNNQLPQNNKMKNNSQLNLLTQYKLAFKENYKEKNKYGRNYISTINLRNNPYNLNQNVYPDFRDLIIQQNKKLNKLNKVAYLAKTEDKTKYKTGNNFYPRIKIKQNNIINNRNEILEMPTFKKDSNYFTVNNSKNLFETKINKNKQDTNTINYSEPLLPSQKFFSVLKGATLIIEDWWLKILKERKEEKKNKQLIKLTKNNYRNIEYNIENYKTKSKIKSIYVNKLLLDRNKYNNISNKFISFSKNNIKFNEKPIKIENKETSSKIEKKLEKNLICNDSNQENKNKNINKINKNTNKINNSTNKINNFTNKINNDTNKINNIKIENKNKNKPFLRNFKENSNLKPIILFNHNSYNQKQTAKNNKIIQESTIKASDKNKNKKQNMLIDYSESIDTTIINFSNSYIEISSNSNRLNKKNEIIDLNALRDLEKNLNEKITKIQKMDNSKILNKKLKKQQSIKNIKSNLYKYYTEQINNQNQLINNINPYSNINYIPDNSINKSRSTYSTKNLNKNISLSRNSDKKISNDSKYDKNIIYNNNCNKKNKIKKYNSQINKDIDYIDKTPNISIEDNNEMFNQVKKQIKSNMYQEIDPDINRIQNQQLLRENPSSYSSIFIHDSERCSAEVLIKNVNVKYLPSKNRNKKLPQELSNKIVNSLIKTKITYDTKNSRTIYQDEENDSNYEAYNIKNNIEKKESKYEDIIENKKVIIKPIMGCINDTNELTFRNNNNDKINNE